MKRKRRKSLLQTKEWKDLRQRVLDRDGRRCFMCGAEDDLVAHHILYRRFYKSQELEQKNLISVCKSCHWKIHKGSHGLKLMDMLMKLRRETYDYVLSKIIT